MTAHSEATGETSERVIRWAKPEFTARATERLAVNKDTHGKLKLISIETREPLGVIVSRMTEREFNRTYPQPEAV